MSYQNITQYDSKNFTPAAQSAAVFGYARKIEAITIHHWGNRGQNFTDVVNFLCTNNKPTSAHYVVEAGKVACIVDPDNVAWHSGNARGNATTIGLELRPEATEADYATAAELVRELRAVYGNLPLRPHNYWSATACPGVWDLAKLDRLARSGATGSPAPTPAPAPKPAPAPAPAVKPSYALRTVTNAVAYARTSPRSNAPVAVEVAGGAQLAVVAYVAGQDPYGTGDNAWYVTKSGYYVWANAASNNIVGLPYWGKK
jgi:N-acetylmuramoyl-L-alanine amidase CwlA